MTPRHDKRRHLTLAPPATGPRAASERQRLATLLRQLAGAVAAPHHVGPDLWRGDDESLTAMAVWSLLESAARTAEATHLSDGELRRACFQAREPLDIATAF